jgi:hypothetical protein
MATEIVDVQLVQYCGMTVTFSDGTSANYLAEELLDLRPHREIVLQLQRAMRMKPL